MSGIDGAVELLAALAGGALVATIVARLVRPAVRLSTRVRPYTVATRGRLGRPADLAALQPDAPTSARRIVAAAADRLGRLVDGQGDEAMARRLEQAGVLRDVPAHARVREYRVRQLLTTGAWAGGLAGGALLAGMAAPLVLLLAGLGALVGATRWPARVDRAITLRRDRIRVELYTVNQLLALHLRTGAGVVQAVRRVTERGRGSVVAELREALTLHRSGRGIVDALEQVARRTPEPNAARTYRLLGNGVQYGSDLAEALRVLSEDLREQRLEALKRDATRRRAAMLLPIVGVLAPVMLLFIAAPLPSLVLGTQ